MENNSELDKHDYIIDKVYKLANRIIGILGTIVALSILIFLFLVGTYLWLVISEEPGNTSKAHAAEQIQQVMFTMWDKFIPISEKILHVVAPVIIMLLAISALFALSRSGASPFDLSKVASDIPSVIALLIIITICLLPLAGFAIPDVLNNVALVVVGFYFGKRKASEE